MAKTPGRIIITALAGIMSFGAPGLSGSPQAEHQPGIPSVTAQLCNIPPVVDGDLADACWQTVEKMPFSLVGGKTEPRAATAAWVTRSRSGLFFAFHCAEGAPCQLKTNVQSRDGGVANDDCVEIFLQPEGVSNYFHLVVSAANVQEDRRCDPSYRDAAWDGVWESATKVTSNAWTAEIYLPFATLAPLTKPTQPWRINLGREKKTNPPENSCWAPADVTFHEQDRFGKLDIMAGKDEDFSLFRLFVVSLQFDGYVLRENGLAGAVSFKVGNSTGLERRLLAEVLDRPVSHAGVNRASQLVALPKGLSETLRLEFPAGADRPRAIEVRLADPADSNIVYGIKMLPPHELAQLMRAAPALSYYTNEREAKILCWIDLDAPGAGLTAQTRLRAGGQELATINTPVSGPMPIAILVPLDDLPGGGADAHIRLLDARGALIAETHARLIKTGRRAAGDVQIDRERVCVMADGRPFFPLGMYRAPAAKLGLLAEAGFNSVIAWNDLDTVSDPKAYYDAAHQAGLKVVDAPFVRYMQPSLMDPRNWMEAGFRDRNDARHIREVFPGIVVSLKDHPALLAWYNQDEPTEDLAPSCRAFYRMIHATDLRHPVLELFAGMRIPTGSIWNECYDIGGQDPYWEPMRNETPLNVARSTANNVRFLEARRTPFWIVLMASIGGSSSRSLTPMEQRCQTYLALIHGAKGIFYFLYEQGLCPSPVPYAPLWEEMQKLAAEIKTLAPVLLEGATASSMTHAPAERADTVHVLAKQYGGKIYLVAVNPSPQAVRAQFRWAGSDRASVRQLFDDRPVALASNGFGDEFAPYASQVYLCSGVSSGSLEVIAAPAPGSLSLMQGYGYKSAKRDPASANLLQNASFEHATNPGWPDWWRKTGAPYVWQDGLIGASNANWAVDGRQVYHGQKSLRLARLEPAGHPDYAYGFQAMYMAVIPVKRDTDLTFSLFMKGDRPDIPVRLSIAGDLLQPASQKFQVTTAWRRYSVSLRIPPLPQGQTRVRVMFDLLGEGMIWADAAQLEEDAAASEFKPYEVNE